jgi:hypothetical protein
MITIKIIAIAAAIVGALISHAHAVTRTPEGFTFAVKTASTTMVANAHCYLSDAAFARSIQKLAAVFTLTGFNPKNDPPGAWVPLIWGFAEQDDQLRPVLHNDPQAVQSFCKEYLDSIGAK